MSFYFVISFRLIHFSSIKADNSIKTFYKFSFIEVLYLYTALDRKIIFIRASYDSHIESFYKTRVESHINENLSLMTFSSLGNQHIRFNIPENVQLFLKTQIILEYILQYIIIVNIALMQQLVFQAPIIYFCLLDITITNLYQNIHTL